MSLIENSFSLQKVTRAMSDSEEEEDDASVDSTSRKEDDYMVGSVTDGQHRYVGTRDGPNIGANVSMANLNTF